MRSRIPIFDRHQASLMPPDENGCIRSRYSIANSGYVQVCGHHKHGKPGMFLGHRIAYEREYGPIPDGMFVCHKCDNRWCQNPRHLFLGTQADNMSDKVSKGRQSRGQKHSDSIKIIRRGSQNNMAKLNEAEVVDARRAYDSGHTTIAELARRYRVKHVTMSRAVKRQTWTFLREEQP